MAMITESAPRMNWTDILTMIDPGQARDWPSMEKATEFAVRHVDEVALKADRAKSGVYGYHAAHEATARFMVKELLRIRNDWLKAHFAFRGPKDDLIDFGA